MSGQLPPGARGKGWGPSRSQPRAQHSGPGKQKPPPTCPVHRASDHQGPATCPVTKPRITVQGLASRQSHPGAWFPRAAGGPLAVEQAALPICGAPGWRPPRAASPSWELGPPNQTRAQTGWGTGPGDGAGLRPASRQRIPLTGHVALGRRVCLSEPQVPHLGSRKYIGAQESRPAWCWARAGTQ